MASGKHSAHRRSKAPVSKAIDPDSPEGRRMLAMLERQQQDELHSARSQKVTPGLPNRDEDS